MSNFFVEILCDYVIEIRYLKPKKKNPFIKRSEIDYAIGMLNIVVTGREILCVSQLFVTRV